VVLYDKLFTNNSGHVPELYDLVFFWPFSSSSDSSSFDLFGFLTNFGSLSSFCSSSSCSLFSSFSDFSSLSESELDFSFSFDFFF